TCPRPTRAACRSDPCSAPRCRRGGWGAGGHPTLPGSHLGGAPPAVDRDETRPGDRQRDREREDRERQGAARGGEATVTGILLAVLGDGEASPADQRTISSEHRQPVDSQWCVHRDLYRDGACGAHLGPVASQQGGRGEQPGCYPLVRLRFRQVHDQASAGCDRRRSELDTSRLDAVEVTGRAVCGCTRRLGSVRLLGLAGTVAVTRFAAARFLAIAVVVATGSGDGDGDGRGLGDNRVVVVVKTG